MHLSILNLLKKISDVRADYTQKPLQNSMLSLTGHRILPLFVVFIATLTSVLIILFPKSIC